MTFILYGYENNPRTRIVAIVAAAQRISLQKIEVVPRNNINKTLLVREFPRSRGKIPALSGPGIKLTEVVAIAVYLAKLGPNKDLMGDGSAEQEAEVLSWVSWSNQELLGTLANWFLPLIPNFSSPAPYDEKAIEAGKLASLVMLEATEKILTGKNYLVGEHITLADIFVAVVMSRGLEWVLGTKWRAQHPNCMQHFETVARWSPVRSVIPEFKFTEEEPRNVNPYI